MINHDRLFKELIQTFFIEFIELLLPQVRDYIDGTSFELLDKELFTDVTAGDQHEVDLVVKVRFKGKQTFFLIHVENQAQPQKDFGKRMFGYFARLYQKYDLPIYPILLLTHEAPLAKEPELFQICFPNKVVLDFRYEVIQLSQMNWFDYVRSENPAASALMAKMRIAPKDRPRVKLECIRMMSALSSKKLLNKAKMQVLRGIVDTYLPLNGEEQKVFQSELEQLAPAEKERVVEVTNFWEERGRQEGLQQGREEGGRQRLLSLVRRQIERKFGAVAADVTERIGHLNADQLETVVDALLEFSDPLDLAEWLRRL
jgi:hypothetical protein